MTSQRATTRRTAPHRTVRFGRVSVTSKPIDDLRPLTPREREILDYLLSVESPGVAELRQQSAAALARPWACGCASIDLVVDRAHARPTPIRARPAIETQSREREDPSRIFDLLLWVEDGWLSGIELVAYGFERHEDANVFPPPADFHPPGALGVL